MTEGDVYLLFFLSLGLAVSFEADMEDQQHVHLKRRFFFFWKPRHFIRKLVLDVPTTLRSYWEVMWLWELVWNLQNKKFYSYPFPFIFYWTLTIRVRNLPTLHRYHSSFRKITLVCPFAVLYYSGSNNTEKNSLLTLKCTYKCYKSITIF